MAKTKPTPAQAQLHLQLYDLRREAKLRQARDWFTQNFFPATREDTLRLAPWGSQENAFMRMVITYWEQACLLLNYGLLHEDLFFRTSSEFYQVWDRLKPVVAPTREIFRNPHLFENLEEAAQRYEKWAEKRAPGTLQAARQYLQQQFRKSAGAD